MDSTPHSSSMDHRLSFVDDLVALIAPPATPILPGTEAEWEAVYSELGTRLPADYVDIVTRYGYGDFYDFFGLVNPFVVKHGLFSQLSFLHQYCPDGWFPNRRIRLYPDAGGLLWIGGDELGNLILYVTAGSPDKWRIAYSTHEGVIYEELHMGIAELMVHMIRGELTPRALGSPLPEWKKQKPDRFVQPTEKRLRWEKRTAAK